MPSGHRCVRGQAQVVAAEEADDFADDKDDDDDDDDVVGKLPLLQIFAPLNML